MESATVKRRRRGAGCGNGQGSHRRSAPFEDEPGFCDLLGLWLYGNARLLLGNLGHVEAAAGPPLLKLPAELDEIGREAERLVLDGRILVCGAHNHAHQRAAAVPPRYGSPRIVVFSGGFRSHLGPELKEEPFRAARLWRYEWDPRTDLAVSRRAPGKLPTFAIHNPTVDRLIGLIAEGGWDGLVAAAGVLSPPLR